MLTSALSAEVELQDLVVIKRIKLHGGEELDILGHGESVAYLPRCGTHRLQRLKLQRKVH